MPKTAFKSFVIFAGMRTGSNFLEESLSAAPGITLHGEAFNPVFIAYPTETALLGITKSERDARPLTLLRRIVSAPGLNGFRFFPDHDLRVLDDILADQSCAKVILNRNPVESYVSLKIARETGQWKLNDARRLKSAQVSFDGAEFTEHLAQAQEFQLRVLHALQISGQTAFYLDYDDIGDAAVLNGLLCFLGVEGPDIAPARSLVPQNPQALIDKVDNPGEMTGALAALDRFNLSRTPNFEPRRGPAVPGFVAAAGAPLLFLPIGSAPIAEVEAWLAQLGPQAQAGVIRGFTQATLRDWMRDRVAHRRFCVLRHPVARAYRAFCDVIVGGQKPELNQHLAKHYKLTLPRPEDRDVAGQRRAFCHFLRFVKTNLNGQTNLRVEAAWASQTAILSGFARFALPDVIIRESAMADDLARLCAALGIDFLPLPAPPASDAVALADIYGDEIETLTHQAYPRDYLALGFRPWGKVD